MGGIGGKNLIYDTINKRVFLGGGGGCGHGNNLADKHGGNGGGIILIQSNTIVGNAMSTNANGSNALECNGPSVGCQDDGTGGGVQVALS